MSNFWQKLKNILLTVFGILFILEMYRRFTSNEDTDVTDLEESIKNNEELLKEIENENPEIDDIVDHWNSRD